MMFQRKLDQALEKLHEEKTAKDGSLTPEQLEAEKESLGWKDYFALTVSALGMILPIALLLLLLMSAAGYFFIVR